MTCWEASLFKVETVACGPNEDQLWLESNHYYQLIIISKVTVQDSPSVQGAAVSWAVQVKPKAMYELSDHFLPKCEEGAWL